MLEISRYHFDRSLFSDPKKFDDILIYQIGRRLCEKNEVIEYHKHLNIFELTVITSGNGTISANNETIDVKAGDIFLSFPGDTHRISSGSSFPIEYDYFAFCTENVKYKDAFEPILINYYSIKNRVFSDNKINNLLSYAICEFFEDNAFSFEILTGIFNQIIVYIIRNMNKNSDGSVSINDQKNSEQLCFKIMSYIDSHIYSIKNLNYLSEVFNYNYSYLSSVFKKTVKKSLNEYFINKKLETAKLLIAENKFSITSIAYMLNYSSVYSFSKSFKAKYGYPPRTVKPKASNSIPNKSK